MVFQLHRAVLKDMRRVFTLVVGREMSGLPKVWVQRWV
jgi:hypothetical protein